MCYNAARFHCETPGDYAVLVKVIDILDNDGTNAVTVEIPA